MKTHIATILILLMLFSAKEAFPQNNSGEEALSLFYPFREISNPIIKDERFEKIIVLSCPRTGSTLMFMIFQYLFEDTLGHHWSFDHKVVKAHRVEKDHWPLLMHPKTYIIVPIRNPIDAFCSTIKVLHLFNKLAPEQGLKVLEHEISEYKKLIDALGKLDKNRLLVFRYEEFNENFFKIFYELENRFKIKISNDEKEKINRLFSKSSVRQHFQNFHSFSEYDSVIGVHGYHISSDKRTLDDFFPKETVEEMHRRLVPMASFFGY